MEPNFTTAEGEEIYVPPPTEPNEVVPADDVMSGGPDDARQAGYEAGLQGPGQVANMSGADAADREAYEAGVAAGREDFYSPPGTMRDQTAEEQEAGRRSQEDQERLAEQLDALTDAPDRHTHEEVEMPRVTPGPGVP